MKLAALAVSLLLFSAAARAEPGDLWGVATIMSHHFTGEKFNQHNYGIGLESETRFKRLSVIGGAYDNSNDRVSAYAGVTWTPLELGPVHAGVIAAALSGYAHRVAAILPTVQIESSRLGANIYYVPKIGSGDCAVLGFQVKAKF